MDVKVSFVILTWNSESYIEDCIRSVLGLGQICEEIRVVDNGSTDKTPCILHSIAQEDGRLFVYEQDSNLGTTKSRNLALRELPDAITHVCILDSDTVVNRSAFETMLSTLESHSGIGVLGPTMVSLSDEVQLSGRNLPTLGLKLRKAWPFGEVAKQAADEERPSSRQIGNLQDVGYLLSACWLMPVSTLERVGMLDEKIFYAPEDVDWCLRCHKAGLRVCLCLDAQIVHRYQRISHKKLLSITNFEHIRGLAYYFLKHRYLFRPPF